MYLVMLAYSLLMSELKQGRAKEWALDRLMTIGEACRAMLKETLRRRSPGRSNKSPDGSNPMNIL